MIGALKRLLQALLILLAAIGRVVAALLDLFFEAAGLLVIVGVVMLVAWLVFGN